MEQAKWKLEEELFQTEGLAVLTTVWVVSEASAAEVA